MKKIMSTLLIIACLMTMVIPGITAYAAETEVPECEITDDAAISAELMDTEPLQTTPAPQPEEWGDEIVARVYLCTTLNSLTGHVWLYFINLTEYELPLGYVTLQPHEEMSVGSLRNSRKDGGGTYYNGEAFMADNLSSVSKHTTSIYMDINYDQLITIGNKIKSKNSYILLGNNCGDFACSCWNSIAPLGKRVVNILVPLFTILGVVMAGGKKGQIEMARPDISRVFKQVNNGVRQAVPESFKASCVNW